MVQLVVMETCPKLMEARWDKHFVLLFRMNLNMTGTAARSGI